MYNQSSRVGDECLEQSPANQPTRSNSELLVSQELLRLQREILQGEPPDLGSKQRQRHKSSGRCESPFSEMEDRCRGYVNRPNPSARWLSGAADDLACLQSHQPMYRSFSERAEFRPSVDRNEHRSTMRSFHDDRDLQHHHVFLPTAAKPKRRRLNSNEMMLEMLNDTGVMSPNMARDTSRANGASALAPMHRRMPVESSLRAYDERKYATNQCESMGTRDFSALHSSWQTNFPEPSHAQDQGREDFMFVNPFLPETSDYLPLPLPPKKTSRAPKGIKIKSRVHPSDGNSNRKFTPTTKAITALSREIKSTEEKKSKVQSGVDSALMTVDRVGNESPCKSDDQIVRFASSIEASQLSQQSIHDWDRKMGLRRAHSKTMRETVRSRMKILTFLKDEGANILALAREGSSRGTGSSDGSNEKASGTEPSAQDAPSPNDLPQLAMEGDEARASGAKSASKKEDENKRRRKKVVDESFINQFRRASLDFVSSILPKGLQRPSPSRSDE